MLLIIKKNILKSGKIEVCWRGDRALLTFFLKDHELLKYKKKKKEEKINYLSPAPKFLDYFRSLIIL